MRVFCDIHSHMNAFILVFSHPFFAMTDAEGRYRIDNVPPGTYNVDRLERRASSSEPQRGRRCRTAASTELDFAAPMKLLSSLRSRIFLTSALLAVLSIGVGDLPRQRRASRARPRTALQREIAATGALVEQLRDDARRRRSR